MAHLEKMFHTMHEAYINSRFVKGWKRTRVARWLRPHESKLYLLADMLTIFRLLVAIVLLIMTMCRMRNMALLGLILFILGELSDAFDGAAARTFLCPKECKKWLKNPGLADKIADISLSIAVMLYIGFSLGKTSAIKLMIVAGMVAITVELSRPFIIAINGAEVERRVVLLRRYAYVLLIFVVAIWYWSIIFNMQWWQWALMILFSLATGFFILILKWPRAKEIDTDLPEAEY